MRTLLTALLLCAVAVGEENPAQKLLESVEMGAPIIGESVTLFPLRTKIAPDDAGVVANTATDALSFSEPELPRRRDNVLVRNTGDKPVLLAGGTVLVGGHMDRLITHDHLIGPGATVELRTLPAAAPSERRREAAPFKVEKSIAPIYLRRKANFGASPSLVPNFVNKWLDFRDEGDTRRSLASIANSKALLGFCMGDCKRAGVPEVLKDPRLVGAVTAVRGRVQSIILYRTNALARAYFFPLVHGATWANAAIVLRAKKLGIPVPGDEDPEKTLARLQKEARDLLDRVRKTRYRPDQLADGEVGRTWIMQTSRGARGRAVEYKGKIVHVVVYPRDPFENRLYGPKQRVPEEGKEDDSGAAELSRRSNGAGRRLTNAERRFLNRAGRNRR